MTARLPYLPAILPDELVYSFVARFGRDTSLPRPKVNQLLFGVKYVVLSYDLPLRLERLAELMRTDASRLLHEHTLLPFHMALKSTVERGDMVDAMLDGRLMHWRAVNPASLAPRPSHLRYCPSCDAENEGRWGTAFWQRRHQLPTSLVCVGHREPLRVSSVSTLHKRQLDSNARAVPTRTPRSSLPRLLPGVLPGSSTSRPSVTRCWSGRPPPDRHGAPPWQLSRGRPATAFRLRGAD